MKILTRCLLALVLMLLLVLTVFWTKDTSRQDMHKKYATAPSMIYYRANEGRIHYRDQGDKANPALVLIHGTSASLHTWEPLVARLQGQFRLISLDLPGHGLTGESPERDYSVQAMVNSVWEVMAHLKIDQATLIGNSLGGRVAWQAALDRPEKINALVLLAPSGVPHKIEAKSNIGFKLLGSSFGQAIIKKVTPRFIIKRSLQQSVFDSSVVTEDTVDRYWELLRMEGNRQAMVDLARTPRNDEEWLRLKQIAAPALVVWGEQDGLLPVQMASVFGQELTDARVVELADVGHLPMEEAVDRVSKEIRQFCSVDRC